MGSMLKATIIYIIGGISLCSYAAYFLFLKADSASDYALWIILPLAWIISYFPIVTPLVSAWQFKKLFNTLQNAKDIKQAIQTADISDEEVMQMIQTHSNLPATIVNHIYPKIKRSLIQHMEQEDS